MLDSQGKSITGLLLVVTYTFVKKESALCRLMNCSLNFPNAKYFLTMGRGSRRGRGEGEGEGEVK